MHEFDVCLKAFRLMTAVVGELARRLSESPLLPFNCVSYARELENELGKFEKKYASDFAEYAIDFSPLRWSIKNFTRVANDFHKRLDSLDKSK